MGAEPLQIREGGLERPEVQRLLTEHLQDMMGNSPPGSVHALSGRELRDPGIRFWSVWEGDRVAGCGALKDLGDGHGEIKSMRTVEDLRGRGVATALLGHMVVQAARGGFSRLSLETGSADFYAPARRLYARQGFVGGPPFGEYGSDPHSVYMTRTISVAQMAESAGLDP